MSHTVSLYEPFGLAASSSANGSLCLRRLEKLISLIGTTSM